MLGFEVLLFVVTWRYTVGLFEIILIFWLYAPIAINVDLRIVLAMSERFWQLMFSFLFIPRYFLDFFVYTFFHSVS